MGEEYICVTMFSSLHSFYLYYSTLLSLLFLFLFLFLLFLNYFPSVMLLFLHKGYG